MYRTPLDLNVVTHSFLTRRSADLIAIGPCDPFRRTLFTAAGGQQPQDALFRRRERRYAGGLARRDRFGRSYHQSSACPDGAAGTGSGSPAMANGLAGRSEEHTSELQSLMRISYAVFCLKTN